MAIDKLNSLQFLMFLPRPYFEAFGDVDGVYVDRVPFELRQRLLQWTWPTTDRDQYFFTHAGRDVITREGWEEFVRWVGQAMDRQLDAESEARVTITREGEYLIARFDDGRVLRHPDTIALADMLLAAGVAANAVQMPDWREGDGAPSSGERIAIFHRMRQATGQPRPKGNGSPTYTDNGAAK